jgi:phosphatidylglycerophosphate synthase
MSEQAPPDARLRRSIVDGLTTLRLPFVLLATWAALADHRLATVTFGLTAVATDVGDGLLARRWEVQTDWGSNFDSLMDFFFYTLLLVWTYLLVPEFRAQVGVIVAFFTAYAVVIGLGFVFRRTIAEHGHLSRAAGTAVVVTAFWYIGFGYVAWLLVVPAVLGAVDLVHRLKNVAKAVRDLRADVRS